MSPDIHPGRDLFKSAPAAECDSPERTWSACVVDQRSVDCASGDCNVYSISPRNDRQGSAMASQKVVWQKAASLSDLADGGVVGVHVGATPIALYKLDGEVYATHGICTHAMAILADG